MDILFINAIVNILPEWVSALRVEVILYTCYLLVVSEGNVFFQHAWAETNISKTSACNSTPHNVIAKSWKVNSRAEPASFHTLTNFRLHRRVQLTLTSKIEIQFQIEYRESSKFLSKFQLFLSFYTSLWQFKNIPC